MGYMQDPQIESWDKFSVYNRLVTSCATGLQLETDELG